MEYFCVPGPTEIAWPPRTLESPTGPPRPLPRASGDVGYNMPSFRPFRRKLGRPIPACVYEMSIVEVLSLEKRECLREVLQGLNFNPRPRAGGR